MFKVNDYVVYNSTGVCKIIDIIKEEDINSNQTEFYVMQPFSINKMTIKVPVNNPNIAMRKIITKDEVLSLVSAMPEVEPKWINDYRRRSENFKTALKTGQPKEWLRLFKTIYKEKKEKSELGRKLMKTDEDMLKTVERHIFEEFAIALNTSPDEVKPYIIKHIA